MSGYPAVLAAAWADHLAPRQADALTVASLFSGCGGSSLGYSMAGYREVLAVERDDHAAAVFRLNFPGVPLHHGDIRDVPDGRIQPGALDVLDGSPPCQGFSTFGLRQLDDPRNYLFREFARLLRAWQPRAFIMENVRGLVGGKMRVVFAEILAELKDAGYVVRARLVDASYLGVPQMRKRIVFAGVRADIETEPAHPVPVTRPVTVREAWAGLDGPGLYDVPSGKGALLAPIVPPGTIAKAALMARGGRPAHFSCIRLAFDRPANTIVKDVRPGTGSGYLHPSESRFCGVRELARLQSFPDEFDWGDGTYKQIHARIGDSVPPLMMRAVATAVRGRLPVAA